VYGTEPTTDDVEASKSRPCGSLDEAPPREMVTKVAIFPLPDHGRAENMKRLIYGKWCRAKYFDELLTLAGLLTSKLHAQTAGKFGSTDGDPPSSV